jgi:polyhydroxyalkanoate synthase
LNTRLLRGEKTFVLAASGHIAGVINPALRNKRHFWNAPVTQTPAQDWLAGATLQTGSWWPHWQAWLAAHGGGRVPAPNSAGSRVHRPLEPAPGRYVRERCA